MPVDASDGRRYFLLRSGEIDPNELPSPFEFPILLVTILFAILPGIFAPPLGL